MIIDHGHMAAIFFSDVILRMGSSCQIPYVYTTLDTSIFELPILSVMSEVY